MVTHTPHMSRESQGSCCHSWKVISQPVSRPMLTASNGKWVFLLAGQYGSSFPRCSERSSRGSLHTSSKRPCCMILFLQPEGLRLVLCQTSGGGHCPSHLEGPLQRVGPGHLRVKCWETHGIYAEEQLTPNEKKKRLEHVSACLVAALLRHELLLVTGSHLSTTTLFWRTAVVVSHEHMMCGFQGTEMRLASGAHSAKRSPRLHPLVNREARSSPSHAALVISASN